MTLTAQEVAKDLKISDLTVYRLVREGRLKSFKVGTRHRFNEEDLAAFKGTKTQGKAEKGTD